MKPITTSRTIPPEPAYEVEDTAWACETPGCGFTTDSEEEAKHHHGKAHAIKDTREIPGTVIDREVPGTFYRFDSEADVLAYYYFKANEDHRIACWAKPKLAGPGWYFLRSWTQRCRRGCCDEFWEQLIPADEHLTALEDEVAKYDAAAKTLEHLLHPITAHPS